MTHDDVIISHRWSPSSRLIPCGRIRIKLFESTPFSWSESISLRGVAEHKATVGKVQWEEEKVHLFSSVRWSLPAAWGVEGAEDGVSLRGVEGGFGVVGRYEEKTTRLRREAKCKAGIRQEKRKRYDTKCREVEEKQNAKAEEEKAQCGEEKHLHDVIITLRFSLTATLSASSSFFFASICASRDSTADFFSATSTCLDFT